MRARVEPHSSEILKPQVRIFIYLRSLQPSRQIRRPSGIGRQQLYGGMKSDFTDGVENSGMIGPTSLS